MTILDVLLGGMKAAQEIGMRDGGVGVPAAIGVYAASRLLWIGFRFYVVSYFRRVEVRAQFR